MKATGIVRRVDDLGRIVIPKEIRRILRIREGNPLHTIFSSFDLVFQSIVDLVRRIISEKSAYESSVDLTIGAASVYWEDQNSVNYHYQGGM